MYFMKFVWGRVLKSLVGIEYLVVDICMFEWIVIKYIY